MAACRPRPNGCWVAPTTTAPARPPGELHWVAPVGQRRPQRRQRGPAPTGADRRGQRPLGRRPGRCRHRRAPAVRRQPQLRPRGSLPPAQRGRGVPPHQPGHPGRLPRRRGRPGPLGDPPGGGRPSLATSWTRNGSMSAAADRRARSCGRPIPTSPSTMTPRWALPGRRSSPSAARPTWPAAPSRSRPAFDDQDVQFSDVTVGPDGRTYITWAQIQGELEQTLQVFVVKPRVAEPGSTTFGPERVVHVEDLAIPFDGDLHANDFRIATHPKHEVRIIGGKPGVRGLRTPAGPGCWTPSVRSRWSAPATRQPGCHLERALENLTGCGRALLPNHLQRPGRWSHRGGLVHQPL